MQTMCLLRLGGVFHHSTPLIPCTGKGKERKEIEKGNPLQLNGTKMVPKLKACRQSA